MHVCKAIRISESRKFLLVESRILGFGIRNTELQESGIQVPLTKKVPGVRNPRDGIQNPNLSWGANISFLPVNEKVPIMQALIFPVHTSGDMSDRRIMKVYSPHGMVMKAFLDAQDLPYVSRRNGSGTFYRPYASQINCTGRSSMH